MNSWAASCVDVPGAELGRYERLDPYLLWAVATRWRFQRPLFTPFGQPSPPSGPPPIRILARSRNRLQAGKAGEQLLRPLRAAGWTIPVVYDALPLKNDRQVWFTAQVPALHVFALLNGTFGPAAAIDWELAVPQVEAETVAQANPMGLKGERDPNAYRPAKRPFDDAVGAARQKTPDAHEGTRPPDQLLAVVDFGGAFLHAEFRNAALTATRIRALWDQGSAAGSWHSWHKPASTGYGREITHLEIDVLLKTLRRRKSDEASVYRELDHLIDYDDARRRIWAATHGTHVLHMAGGRHDPLLPPDSPAQDAASRAPLVFVQVPSLSAADCSGASMGAQLLDALHYVLSHCGPDPKVVVNVSHGTYAGPHDGTSLIEQAIADLVQDRPGLAVVLAAGNARQRQGHLHRVVQGDISARLSLQLVPGDSTPTFVEIWCGPPHSTRAVPAVRARARKAGGQWSDWVAPNGTQFLLDDSTRQPAAMLRHQQTVPSGARPMLLLALAPTMLPVGDSGPLASAGLWEIELGLVPNADGSAPRTAVAVDAWIERDDPGDFSAGEQTHFLGDDADDAGDCLSSLCSGPQVVVVGGFRRSDGVQASYSSDGPLDARSQKVMAACEESARQPGIRAAAVRSGDTFVMNGTSVAAPVVARRLYNWLVDKSPADLAGHDWRHRALQDIVEGEHGPEGQQAVKDWPA